MATNVEDRFWSKVIIGGPADCWPWTAAKNWRGVGLVHFKGHKNVSAPRAAWELAEGPIPEGAHVLHRCDNPSCCNPGHLFLGDHAANMRDKAAKGRARRGLQRIRLRPEQIAEAARLHRSGATWAELGRRYGGPYQTVKRAVIREGHLV